MMISVEEALHRILENLPLPAFEEIDSVDAQGRVLAAELRAPCGQPSFDKSAVDGYALRAADVAQVPAGLACLGEIRAGGSCTFRIARGQAATIMTGAPVPEGADAVQMLEHTRRTEDGAGVSILKRVQSGENIVRLGSEAAAGEVILEAGRFIGPMETAVLATFGHARVTVCRRPRVALVSTGDELVEYDQTPQTGQIRNSNRLSLTAQLRHFDVDAEYLGIARDDKADLTARIREGLRREVLILTGGVSVGAYDLVKDVLVELGLEVVFSRVAMKPGKPTVFARMGRTLVFGLPGNPISSFMAFECLVRPALGRLCGFAKPELPRVRGELLLNMEQRPGRTAFLPACVSWQPDGWRIRPLRWKGSSDVVAFSRANAAVIFPAARERLSRGETVEAMLLPDFLQRSANDGSRITNADG